MENFSELLNRHIRRTGISDTELARSIGVSRQTIFRWREGLTSRPRHRDDVLLMARKFRLTPEEQDQLLLAAGFRPESANISGSQDAELPAPSQAGVQLEPGATSTENFSPIPTAAVPPQPAGSPDEKAAGQVLRPALTAKAPRAERRTQVVLRRIVGGMAAVIALAALLYFSGTLPINLLSPGSSATPVPSDRSVVLVTHFANYASSQVGYNVAGRLAEALEREVEATQLSDVQIDIWPEPVGRREEALRVGRAASATLVIYGEYDVGRVVVEFAYPADRRIFTDPALRQDVLSLEHLSATINTELPQQVRSLALIALGQIYLNQDKADQARPLLRQARDNLRGDPAVEEKTWALANFYLGIAYQRSRPADLDRAIAAYTEAIDRWPQMIASRLNRIAAYEARNQPGDLARALADADALITAAPQWGLAYNNRASIRLSMGGPKNLTLALNDIERSLALEPELPEAYLNRAIAYFGLGQTTQTILPDVEKALALRPAYGNAFNLLCWGYALEQQPEVAFPHCLKAVEADPTEPLFQDSRGLAYALLGDYAAATADFETYAAWLEAEQPSPEWERDAMRRRAWIGALQKGENPFNAEILKILRQEYGQ